MIDRHCGVIGYFVTYNCVYIFGRQYLELKRTKSRKLQLYSTADTVKYVFRSINML